MIFCLDEDEDFNFTLLEDVLAAICIESCRLALACCNEHMIKLRGHVLLPSC